MDLGALLFFGTYLTKYFVTIYTLLKKLTLTSFYWLVILFRSATSQSWPTINCPKLGATKTRAFETVTPATSSRTNWYPSEFNGYLLQSTYLSSSIMSRITTFFRRQFYVYPSS